MDDQDKKQTDDLNTQPVNPVSVSHKEIGPLQASDKEPVLHPEVTAAGVEPVSEKPKLTEEHEKIGVTASGESTPVATEPSGIVQLPMSDQEVSQAIKEGPGGDNDVQKQFEGIYFANARFFLANLLLKIKRRLSLSKQ